MKIFLKGICFLVYLSLGAQINSNFIIDPHGDYSKLDFSGDWYPTQPLIGNTYLIHIEQRDSIYSGNYCFTQKELHLEDCSSSENLILRLDENRLHAVFFSKLGGMIEGTFTIIDSNTITWKTNIRLGKSIVPDVMDFARKNKPLFKDYKINKIKIDTVLSTKDIDFNNGLSVDKTTITLAKSDGADSTLVTQIDSLLPNGNAFLVKDFNKGNLNKEYLVTINRSKREISRILLNPEPKKVGLMYELVPEVYIDKNLNVILIQKIYKGQKLEYEMKNFYKLDSRGKYALQLNPAVTDADGKGKMKFIELINAEAVSLIED